MTTKRAQRFDAGELSSPKRLPNGFLRADSFLTRAGVFVYRNLDGSERREYRPPDVVFSEDSLDTLRMTALTMGHPSRPVTADNARGLSIGSVGQDVRREGDRVRATITVTDGESIGTMARGRRQLSCGYWATVENVSGVTEDGEEYDAIQREIVYNHVAVVDRGRAGPDVAARLDAYDEGADVAIMVLDDVDEDSPTVDGVSTPRADNPYSIKREGSAWLVLKDSDGRVMGRHESREAALRQLAALEAAEAEDGADAVDDKRDEKPGSPIAIAIMNLAEAKGLTVGELATAAGVGEHEMRSMLSGAVVPTGKQIEGIARLLDTSADALKDLLSDKRRAQTDGVQPMNFKINLDGVPHEFEASESAQHALTQALARAAEAKSTESARADAAEEKIADVEKAHADALAAEKARADAAEEKAADLASKLDAATSPEAIRAAVDSRVALEKVATRVCGDDFNADGMSDDDVRRAVVVKLAPSAAEKIDAGDSAYLRARFDQAVESLPEESDKPNESVARVRAAAHNVTATASDRVAKARADAIERNRNLWQKPLAASKDATDSDVKIAG